MFEKYFNIKNIFGTGSIDDVINDWLEQGFFRDSYANYSCKNFSATLKTKIRCTLLDYPSVFFLASLPFLSCCHRTTTTREDDTQLNDIAYLIISVWKNQKVHLFSIIFYTFQSNIKYYFKLKAYLYSLIVSYLLPFKMYIKRDC